MKAMIFAAGLGTRLRPLTDTLPKALVPLGGKPLLYHVVTKLKAAGFDEVVINVHHFADSVVAYVHEQEDFGIKVSFSDERDALLETGGAILHARPFLEGSPFLVHNVDIISDLDLRWFTSQACSEAVSNILVSDRKTERYLLFDDEMFLVGWTNEATGEVRSPYPGIDPLKLNKFAFSGIHLISDRIFTIFEEDGWSGRFPVMDFYLSECARHKIRGIVANDLRMMDIGKVGTLEKAEHFLSTIK